MDRQHFQRYIDAFNAMDYDTVAEYFDDNVSLALPAHNPRGPEGIKAHYRNLHQTVRELLRVDWLCIEEDRMAFECYTEFHAIEDAPNLSMGALTRGQVLKCTNFVHYDLKDNRFADIRVGRYKIWEITTSELASA